MAYNVLKDYQREAVDELKLRIKECLSSQNKKIVFKSPTGSGKTRMITAVFDELYQELPESNYAVVWCSIGKGNLHEQSFKAVKGYLNGNPVCSLLDTEFFGSREYIKKHEIVFVNWEKLVDQDKEGKWINNLMKDKEGANFIKVIDNSKLNGTKLVLVVDESHIGASNNTKINQFINKVLLPDMTIEMSATPVFRDQNFLINVPVQKVIDEGMIKSDVIVNKGIKEDIENMPNTVGEELILESAFKMRNRLAAEYKKVGSNVNPLCLIQIKNVEAGAEMCIRIKDFLREKGITEENGKLGFWFDRNRATFDLDAIKENNNKLEFLVFKTAISTGWDCPRAHILVKFRESDSETFEVQTLGRVLRTAEAHSYDNTLLDSGYVFSNIRGLKVVRDVEGHYAIKTLHSSFRLDENKHSVYSAIHQKSFYRSREDDYNAADARFSAFFEKEFITEFNIDPSIAYAPYNPLVFAVKGFKIPDKVTTDILDETVIKASEIDIEKEYEVETNDIVISDSEVRQYCKSFVSLHMNSLAFVRSFPFIITAISNCFDKYLNGVFTRQNKITGIYKTIIANQGLFGAILDRATLAFLAFLATVGGKHGKYIDNFEIASSRSYESSNKIEATYQKSLYVPFYVAVDEHGHDNPLERDFMRLLDSSSVVDWFWQNDIGRQKTNFGIPYDGELHTFQPDFIVKYKDGTIGIYDTKAAGDPRRAADTKKKAECLQDYLIRINSNRGEYWGKVVGGIVIKKNGVLYLNSNSPYFEYDKKPRDFVPFEDDHLFKIEQRYMTIKQNKELLKKIEEAVRYYNDEDE